ncbi:MAG: POTRA domain-containing protein, partial [Gammaproteobacteria bacterium]
MSVSDIDDSLAWRVEEIAFSGNESFADGTLYEQMLTQQRPWYAPWRAYPRFDPVTFRTDLERVGRYYEAQGYYGAGLTHDLVLERSSGLVAIHIALAEGLPVTIDEIAIEAPGGPPEEDTLRRLLPIEVGQVFKEARYQNGEQTLRDYFLARGHAHVETERHAKVDRETG